MDYVMGFGFGIRGDYGFVDLRVPMYSFIYISDPYLSRRCGVQIERSLSTPRTISDLDILYLIVVDR